MRTSIFTLATLVASLVPGTAHATCSIAEQIEWGDYSRTEKLTIVQTYTAYIRLQCDALENRDRQRACDTAATRMYADASRLVRAGQFACMPDIAHKYFE